MMDGMTVDKILAFLEHRVQQEGQQMINMRDALRLIRYQVLEFVHTEMQKDRQ